MYKYITYYKIINQAYTSSKYIIHYIMYIRFFYNDLNILIQENIRQVSVSKKLMANDIPRKYLQIESKRVLIH